MRERWIDDERGWERTAGHEGPKRSEDGSIIITQPRESLGEPSVWRAIVEDVPTS